MKFREIFRFEICYLLRHFSTWLLFGIFLTFGFMILRMVTLTDETFINAPGTIAFFTIFGSSIWVVIGGGIAGEAATRDIQTSMHPLVYTSSVSKMNYLGGKFLAALVLNLLILSTLFIGFLLSIYGSNSGNEFLDSFRLESYLTSFGFLALPAVIATTAIQFTFAAISGLSIAGYIASIVIIIFSQFGGTTVLYALDWKVIGRLMDLLGTSIAAEMEGWTPIERNTRLVSLSGIWLWNRLAWFTLAICALAFTYFRFRFGHVTQSSGNNLDRVQKAGQRHKEKVLLSVDKGGKPGSIRIPSISRDWVSATYVSQVWALSRSTFCAVAGNWAGLTLMALVSIGTGLFATEYMEFFGVPLYARTEEVLRILTPALSSYKTQWIIIPLLIIFYASELVWRDRDAGINELYDTAPVSESVSFLGKFIGLAMVIAIWTGFLIGSGIINQLVMGYYNFEVLVYVKALFGFQFTNYLLFAWLILVIQILVNQKYLGLIIGMGAYGFLLFSPTLGIEHKMLIYASDTGWSYSDMNGFNPFIGPWLSFKIFWASTAFLFSIIAILFWVRSREGGFPTRIQLAKQRFTKHKAALFTALILVLYSGAFIFYNTNVLNDYLQKTDYLETRAAYERLYGQYKSATQPKLIGVKLKAEIYPEQNLAIIQGTYHLVNNSQVTLDYLHFSTTPRSGIAGFNFDRAAKPVIIDNDLGYRIYTLQDPLGPGDSVQINFVVEVNQRGFSNDGVNLSVIRNGSHIKSDDWMPVVGFDDDRRIYNESDRENYKLPPRPVRASLQDVTARNDVNHAQQIDFEAIVGTAEDQFAVAPGALQDTWTEGGRRYFHYATDTPIHNYYAIFSAEYEVREAQWIPDSLISGKSSQNSVSKWRPGKPVTIQIYFHPEHDQNIDRMVKSAQSSLEYYSKEFGKYPYSHFRVLERPGPGRGMHADPMTIDYESGYSLMNPQPNGLDLPYHIMSHEVAHQWWGLYLSPAPVEGSSVLVESLATYSAMQVVEETLGYEHLLRYLSQMRQEYEVPRSRAAPPLLRANNRFMSYRKGPFAFFALRNYIGKDKVNDALRQMLKEDPSEPPLPTTIDLYRELKAVTPDSLQYLLHDLFAENTFWELQTEKATSKRIEMGKWEVTLEMDARKVTVDSMGNENVIPMDDWIEVGIYGSKEIVGSPVKQLYLQKSRIVSGKTILKVVVPEEPRNAGIDPNHLLIDLDLENNTRKIEYASGSQ